MIRVVKLVNVQLALQLTFKQTVVLPPEITVLVIRIENWFIYWKLTDFLIDRKFV